MWAEVVRALLKEYDADAGMVDMLVDFSKARFSEGMEEDLDKITKAYYTMMEAAQQPLHEYSTTSQLDDISRLIGLKSQLGISREGFDLMLVVVGTLLPKEHFLPKNMYES
jgi:hypothetical protein